MNTSPGPTTHEGSMPPVVLSRGRHLAAQDGICLMEAVSVAAQLPWSDSPSCTHPLVAHLARLVNDAMSPKGRPHLTALIPQLQAAHAGDPAAAAHTTARVAAVCTERALRVHPSPLLVHLHHVAVAALGREERLRAQHPGPNQAGDPALAVRVRRALFGRGQAVRGVEAAVLACLHLDETERDRALLDLLRAGLLVTPGRRPALDRVR